MNLMFELSVQREFCAAHAIRIRGKMEPVHGHNWRVTAVVAGEKLDDDGLLIDFHLVEKHLDSIIQPLNNSDLNQVAAMKQINPTAENVVQFIARKLQKLLPGSVQLKRVSVTEAPGCCATYRFE